jgi:hypothetical protein
MRRPRGRPKILGVTRRYNLLLDETIKTRIEEIARREERTEAQVIRRLLRRALESLGESKA